MSATPLPKRHFDRFLHFSLGILLILASGSIAYDFSASGSSKGQNHLPAFTLKGVKSLLIVAPHPDDETLAAGGLIQAALAEGIQVRVVFLTNGDGQWAAGMVDPDPVPFTPADYVHWGEKRQAEAVTAMARLGLTKDRLYFLGYPDGGLQKLWLADWNRDCPLDSVLTHARKSPYPTTFDQVATYCGADLLGDLESILRTAHPDLILLPHPNDAHPDHAAASNFARLAIASLMEADPGYQPDILGYLVHFEFFPQPRGQRLNEPLLPPTALADQNDPWEEFDLTPSQAANKLKAIQDYSSQMQLLGGFLTSFARKDEIFLQISLADLPILGYSDLMVQDADLQELSIQEPKGESAKQMALAGADLVGWKVLRVGDYLFLTAETRRQLIQGLKYQIFLKTPRGTTYIYDLSSPEMSRHYNSFTLQVNLADMGDPRVLGFAAYVSKGTVLDRTGWSFSIP